HLVIKSRPRVRPGEEKNIPATARSLTVRMSQWMVTSFVADVRPETRGHETRYHLRAVALGLGTNVGGRDVVITPGTAEDHGGAIGRCAQSRRRNKSPAKKGSQTEGTGVVGGPGPGVRAGRSPRVFPLRQQEPPHPLPLRPPRGRPHRQTRRTRVGARP